MGKQSQLSKAMDVLRDQVIALDTKRAHLLEVLDTLKAQNSAKPARKPKAKLVLEQVSPGRSQP